MKRKLFPNIKRITTMFSIAIICMTLTMLTLRLTVFSDIAASAAMPAAYQPSSNEPQGREQGMFPFSLNSSVYFATPQSRGDFKIQNPETNEHYMTVSVILPSTGENLMYTGFIKPGESRDDAPLHIQMPEGTYECIAEITAYDPQTLKPKGSEQCDITLYIGEKAK